MLTQQCSKLHFFAWSTLGFCDKLHHMVAKGKPVFKATNCSGQEYVKIFWSCYSVRKHMFEVTVFWDMMMWFEVLAAMVMKSHIFWDILLCSPLKVNWYFWGTCCLYLQGQRISQARHQYEAGSKQRSASDTGIYSHHHNLSILTLLSNHALIFKVSSLYVSCPASLNLLDKYEILQCVKFYYFTVNPSVMQFKYFH
jgi:hypothetical protein